MEQKRNPPKAHPVRRATRKLFTAFRSLARPFTSKKEYVERNLAYRYEHHRAKRHHRHAAHAPHHAEEQHAPAENAAATPQPVSGLLDDFIHADAPEGEIMHQTEQRVQELPRESKASVSAEATAPTVGTILPAEEKQNTHDDAVQVEEALLAEAENDAFLGKVALRKDGAAKPAKVHGWQLLKNRLFGGMGKQNTALPGHIQSDLAKAKEDLQMEDAKDDAFLSKADTAKTAGGTARPRSLFKFLGRTKVTTPAPLVSDSVVAPVVQDTFLQHVEQKKVHDVVGTSGDHELPGSLEDLASGSVSGHIVSADDAKKDPAPVARKEEPKQELVSLKTEKPTEEKKDTIVETPKPVKKVQKRAGGFQRFLASLGHIGLGKERMRFVQNMATMLNAGLPLVDALKTLQLETRVKPMKKMLQKILDAVENGSPLWRAMDEQSFFSLHAIALVRIGEEAGNLAENMEYLAEQEEKDHELRSKVKMAMIYPSIVLIIMFIIVIGLGMFVLPNLITVLFSLNVELPLVTRLVIMFTNMFTEYGAVGVPAFLVGCIFLAILAKYTALKVIFQWVMFHIPGIGQLAREATIARFGVILGGLLKAGVPVIEAMQSLVNVTPIVSYRRLYERMLEHISVGDSFSKSFSSIRGSERLLPPSVQQLVITGEKSGSLADIMLKIADIYDKKASETAQKLPVILEPMLLLFIGGLVGTIAFAIIVPIYSIVGNVGR